MTANEIKKAYVTAVPFGSLSIEGLMDTEGNYYVAARQAASQLQLTAHPSNAVRSLERILGEGYKRIQLQVEGTKTPSTVITLTEFERLLRKADREGNEIAQAFVRAMVGLSLTQLFSDAFGIKHEQEERQAYVKAREVHRVTFRPKYTDHLKNDGCKNYGKEVNRIKLSAGVPLKPIEELKADEVQALNEKEIEYNLLRKLGYSHNKALRTI